MNWLPPKDLSQSCKTCTYWQRFPDSDVGNCGSAERRASEWIQKLLKVQKNMPRTHKHYQCEFHNERPA